MNVDLHCHTRYSFDAVSDPYKLLKKAQQHGLDAIAITDHNTIRGWKSCREASKALRFPVILGEEVKTVENGKKVGDIIALFLSEEIPIGLPAEVFDAIRDQGGIAIIPHPFDSQRRFRQLEFFGKRIDAIETLNARVWTQKNNERAALFAQINGIPAVGSSDAHMVSEVGAAYTVADCTDLEGFQKALRKGKIKPEGKKTSVFVHAISTLAKTGIIGRSTNWK